jgi:hypothetical protein
LRLVGLVLALVLLGQEKELMGDHQLTAAFAKDGSESVSQVVVKFSMTAPKESGLTSGPIVLELDGIVIPEAGDYGISIDVDGETLGDLILQATQGPIS